MYSYVLLLHVLAATIWTGGHLVLAFAVLPRALATQDPAVLLAYESAYERVGMPALLVQAASGLWMAHGMLPDAQSWLTFFNRPAMLISFKLGLLTITLLAAIDARLRIIPSLSAATLPVMARRIMLVTVVSVLFVCVGVAFRGGLVG